MPIYEKEQDELEALYKFLKRVAPGDGIERDEEWLRLQLIGAHAYFTSGLSYERDGVRRALSAVIGYVAKNIDLPADKLHLWLEPLRRLERALGMLDHGRVEPVLEPGPSQRGAPSLSLDELEFRFVVALATIAKKRGDTVNPYKYVADQLALMGFKRQRLGRDGRYRNITATTVKNWVREAAKNWKKIEAAKQLNFDQYFFPIYQLSPKAASDETERDTLCERLLKTTQMLFGHLAV